MDRAADSGPYNPSLIPLGEIKEYIQKEEARVGPYFIFKKLSILIYR